jgi:hypothetical protein
VGSVIDHHGRHLPRKGCHALPARVSLRLLAFGVSPRGHEIFHHGTILELVFQHGVHMVRIGCFEKFLKMVFWLPRLALEIVLGGHDILLIGVVCFLVIIVATGSDCDPSGVSLLPLLATHNAFLSAFTDGFGRCRPATVGDHLPIA